MISPSGLKRSGGRFDIDKKRADIADLEAKTSQPSFWQDQDNAKKIMANIVALKKTVEQWQTLSEENNHADELRSLAATENDHSLADEISAMEQKMLISLETLERETRLSGPMDKNNAIVSIHAGAGGTESCDWAQMLLRMYMRWAEQQGFSVEVTDILSGEEAGIKSVTFLINGRYAYGMLQAESGVHRLVRISPFDANKRRHTSFSSVDVIPEIDESIDIKIEDKDIRIDTYRASGAGGQHINKTDSAVRITHIQTNIVVQCQTERSQIKNRATAMKLLKAKLYEIEMDKRRAEVERHYDEKGAIAWGSQIRSYVFMPYQLVKDHRTGAEVAQVDTVMNGGIDPFINAYLAWKLSKKE